MRENLADCIQDMSLATTDLPGYSVLEYYSSAAAMPSRLVGDERPRLGLGRRPRDNGLLCQPVRAVLLAVRALEKKARSV